VNLILLGPPGAGKGTQSAELIRRLGIPQISTGDTIRAAIRERTPLGQQAESYANSGRLVPDPLIIGLVRDRIARADCAAGFLLDGFPRTVAQAEALDEMLATSSRSLDHVLLLEVPDDVLLERITGRRSDPRTGRVYHVRFDPPPPEVVPRLIQRRDDTAEVFEERLRAYHAQTAPLIPFYDATGLLRRIDGTGSKDQIRDRILSALNQSPAS